MCYFYSRKALIHYVCVLLDYNVLFVHVSCSDSVYVHNYNFSVHFDDGSFNYFMNLLNHRKCHDYNFFLFIIQIISVLKTFILVLL